MIKSFNWEFPYPSQRMPVMARNVVATSHPLAGQAGLKMLLDGGNAVDAALAAAITLAVVEPTNNGIGSDAFAIVWDGKKLHGLNASGRSPAAWSPRYFAGIDAMPLKGWGAVTVPGAVSAWVDLSERFGRLPFEKLFLPAIQYASDGFLVTPIVAGQWAHYAPLYRECPGFVEAFLPDGHAPLPGDKFSFKAQARTLEGIAGTKGKAFYQGELAEKIVAFAKRTGGVITHEDLATHEAEWVETITQDYLGYTLHEIPPNGQGLAALLMLGILKHRPMQDYPVDSADSLHVQIEAMKLAFADAHRYIADQRYMDVEVSDLLNPDYLAERARLIDMTKAQDFDHGLPRPGGTVYLTAADAEGMMVSFIQSNFYNFGSGVVIPETGISLQSRGCGFTLKNGHPNQVAGSKRPFHTIIPGFVTREGRPIMSFGVMGGPLQPQGHVQMMIRIFLYHQNPQAASDAPRWLVKDGFKVGVEIGFKEPVLGNLMRRGHALEMCNAADFGGAQCIYRLEEGYLAASDHRKDGQAVGF